MVKLLFGDNQFFGINHMSEEKARQQAIRFQNLNAIMNVLEVAYDAGINTFMCTTHDRINAVCERVRSQPTRFADFTFYPSMPYAHKYANAVTESGIIGTLKKYAPDEGLFNTFVRSGKSIARKDIEGVITLLVDAEMKMFHGLRTPVIWLQNVVVDLLLGIRFDSAFAIFSDYVRSRYNAEPGFITMNLPLLLESLDSVGVTNPLICSNINKIGFRMSGGIEAYRSALERSDFRAVAMSVFASGAIPPEEALQWISIQPNIEAIVFGASSKSHILATQSIVNSLNARPQI